MTMQHTQGLWKFDGKAVWAPHGGGENIARDVAKVKREGDGRLIAEAPAMLAALREAVARVTLANSEGEPMLSAWLPDAAAILARIDGAAPTPTAQPAGADMGILRTVAGTDADWLAVTASRDNPGGAIGEAGGGVRTVRADHLAALVGAATSYAEDLASGLEDGTYSDRADLEAVNAAIAAVTGEA